MNCEKIIKKYLEDNGFDGLYVPGECACAKDDLMPCDDSVRHCQPGYRREAEEDDEFDWFIGPEKCK